MTNKEKLVENTILALQNKLTEDKKDDILVITRALDSNNIPYKLEKDHIILDYDNKYYNNSSKSDKDSILIDDNGKVLVSCVLSSYYMKFVSEKDKQLFYNQGQSVLDSKGWVNSNENLTEIVRLFSVVNKVYTEAQNEYNNETTDYTYLSKYIKPIIEVSFESKYNYNKNNINKIKELSKDEQFISSIIDFIKSQI